LAVLVVFCARRSFLIDGNGSMLILSHSSTVRSYHGSYGARVVSLDWTVGVVRVDIPIVVSYPKCCV